MKHAWIIAGLFALLASPALAQKTPAQIQSEINASIVISPPGGITAPIMKGILSDLATSGTASLNLIASPGVSGTGTYLRSISPTITGVLTAQTIKGASLAVGGLGDGNPGYSIEAFPTSGGSFGASAFNFNDQTVPTSANPAVTHYAMTIEGNSPATGVGSYEGLFVTQVATARPSGSYITALQATALDYSGATGSGNWSGSNPQCLLLYITGTSCVGEEIDIDTAHTPVNIRQGLRIADLGSAAGGSPNDSAIGMGNFSGYGWTYGILYGDATTPNTNPVHAGGELINFGTTSSTLLAGLDFRGVPNYSIAPIVLANIGIIAVENAAGTGQYQLISGSPNNTIAIAGGGETTTVGGPMQLPNNLALFGLNAADNADLSIALIDASNNLDIGVGGTPVKMSGTLSIGGAAIASNALAVTGPAAISGNVVLAAGIQAASATGGAASKYVCADSGGNWFAQTAAC